MRGLLVVVVLVTKTENPAGDFTCPEALVSLFSQVGDGFLGPAEETFAAGDFVGYAHEERAEAFALPGREDQDAGEVVVVPGHFLLGEEADYLAAWLYDRDKIGVGIGRRGRRGVNEEVVLEAGDVEEDRFVVEKELGEEGEVLAKELGGVS